MSRGALGSLLLAALGCGPKAQPPPVVPPEPAPAPATESLGEDIFVSASALAPDEDQAYAQAQRALTVALLGDPAWAELVSITVHRRDTDPLHAQPVADGVEVAVGLSRMGVASVLSAFENGEPQVVGPPPWRETLASYLGAHVGAQACARRAVLFESSCEADTSQVDGALTAVLDGVVLVPVLEGGVPVDLQGKPLREPEAFVLWKGMPLVDLPLVATRNDPTEPVPLRSDAKGRVQVPVNHSEPYTPVSLHIDGRALVGPLHERVPQAEVTLEVRELSPSRWTLAVARGDQRRKSDEAEAVIREQMKAEGYGEPRDLSKAQAKGLLSSDEAQRGREASVLADAMGGRVDVVLVLRYDTRFASRMGGSRVWFEAEGTLEAREAWTGEVLSVVQAKVEADGVGEARADEAARRKLAGTLIERTMGALRP